MPEPLNRRSSSGDVAGPEQSPFAHFVSILERISDGFFALDLDWRFTYVNAAGAALVGMPRDALVGRVCWEVFPESAGTTFEREFRRAMSTGVAVQLEEYYPPADAWLNISVCPVPDGLTLYARSATRRRRTGELLRFQATLLNAVGQSVIAVDAEGVIDFWNAAAEALYGWTAAEAIGRKLVDTTYSARARGEMPVRMAALARGESWTGETERRDKSGREFYVSVTLTPTFDDAGQFRGVVGVSHDVSERRKAEAELRRQALVFGTISDAVVAIDLEGAVVDWNPAAERLFGYSKEEMLGRQMAEIHDPPVHGELDRSIRIALTRDGKWSGEIPFRRKDGSAGISEVEIVAHHDAAGAPVGYIGVNRDVTDRRRLEEQLRQSQKMDAVGQLAGGVAHDFNNILTIIKTYTEFLLEDVDEASPLRADVLEIQTAGRRAAALTQQLLAFSRHQLLQPRVLDLNDVVAGIEPMLRRVIGEDIRIVLQPAAELWPVLADPGQLEQVLVNLAVNARDAMAKGGTLTIATANVSVGEEADPDLLDAGDWVRLDVTDTGIGMDDATKARAFEPFFTTKPPGKGTGLGLSTVYGIVKQSSGTIRIETARNRSTTFTIHLPRAEPQELRRATPQGSAAVAGAEVVLLVEDEDAVRALARRVLERQGYTVLEASNGREGIGVAESYAGQIDLLVTDMVMPELGGAELFRALHPVRPAMRVLYMSGYTEDDIIRRGMFDPGTASLRKPFTPVELAREVRRVLDE
ncbi:MAG: hybrid sensor histidine kinase/response regulator [Gemmatimonadetes bacterium]|nr:hybrid sensor histidine kinase/response regulator [Gemmatimonadota bacterium]